MSMSMSMSMTTPIRHASVAVTPDTKRVDPHVLEWLADAWRIGMAIADRDRQLREIAERVRRRIKREHTDALRRASRR